MTGCWSSRIASLIYAQHRVLNITIHLNMKVVTHLDK